jgi:hypothetical protein
MQTRLNRFLGGISERYRHIYVVLLVTVCVGLLDFVADHVLIGFNMSEDLHSALQAGIVGLGSALAVWTILISHERQRRMEREEIRKVAELNHYLRNSLEVIADAHYFDTDMEHKKMILDTVKAIDQKLRQLFPGKDRPM